MSVVIWWMKIAVTLQLPRLAYQQIRVKDMTWNAIVEFAGQRTIKGHIGDKDDKSLYWKQIKILERSLKLFARLKRVSLI